MISRDGFGGSRRGGGEDGKAPGKGLGDDHAVGLEAGGVDEESDAAEEGVTIDTAHDFHSIGFVQ